MPAQAAQPVVEPPQPEPPAPVEEPQAAQPTNEGPATAAEAVAEAQRSEREPVEEQKKAPAPQEPPKPNAPWHKFTGAEKRHPITCGWAQRVRSVHSGDTMFLALKKNPNKPLTSAIQVFLTLDGIRTPRVARKASSQPDKEQPFGFEAREFIRKTVTNRPVFFAVWQCHRPPNESQPARHFGDVYLEGPEGRQSLTYLVVANGWGELLPKEKCDLSDKLSKLIRIRLPFRKQNTF